MLSTLGGTSSVVSNALCRNIEILDTILEEPGGLAVTPLNTGLSKDLLVARGDSAQRQLAHAALRKAMDQRLVSAWVVDIETEVPTGVADLGQETTGPAVTGTGVGDQEQFHCRRS